jgi:glycosyltransferase involved in cell wall biosynthesis
MKILYVYLTDIRKNLTHLVQIFQMCSALSEVHEVSFFHPFLLKGTLNKRLNFFDIHVSKGFRITRIAAFGPLDNKYLDFANRVIFFFQVLFYLRFSKHDLIYTRDFSFLVFLSRIPKFLRPKKKIVYEPHNVYYYVSDKVNDLKLEVESLKLADIIIATSSGIKHDLIQIGVNEHKINVASNGVNIDRFSISFDRDMFRKNNNISENELVIIYLGSWEEWKGVNVLIRAYAKVLDKVSDCKLILVGGSKEELIKANELIKSLNIDGQEIQLAGFISQTEVVKYLKISDIGVIPNTKTIVGSRYTSPLKLFEYMAAGLAIVTSDLPSMREVLTEKEAVFFRPENEYDLADKMIDLINNKSKREQMKFLIRQRVKEFTYEERCKKVVDIIEKIS